MQVYTIKSVSIAGRRDEWEEVKPAVNAEIWFSVRTTIRGWKRREGEGAMKKANLICALGVVRDHMGGAG